MENRWAPIPQQFHSLLNDGLFTHCCHCKAELLDSNRLYSIERYFDGEEPVFEMAICIPCHGMLFQELSVDSRQRITAYSEERFVEEYRSEAAESWSADDVTPWLEQCIYTKKKLSDCRSYQIAGVCRGREMALDSVPVMVSDLAAKEMINLMSKKTRDRLGELINDLFGMPSEFAPDPARPPLLF